MSSSVHALLDLIDEGPGGDVQQFAHQIGLVSAEVIASSPTSVDAASITSALQRSMPRAEDAKSSYATILGLFQKVRDGMVSQTHTGNQGSVKERVLFVLAGGSRGVTELSNAIGTDPAVVSRALRNLREHGLVKREENSGPADARYKFHELTEEGAEFVDSRIAGSQHTLGDSGQGDRRDCVQSDLREELQRLLKLARWLTKREPTLAHTYAMSLERVKENIEDPALRAEALGELSVIARSVKGLFDKIDLKRWLDELEDLAELDSSIAARAYYERARWRAAYEPQSLRHDAVIRDLGRSAAVAEKISDPDSRFNRLAWCYYHQALIQLRERQLEPALELISCAQKHFSKVADAELDPDYGVLLCKVVQARVLWESGERPRARSEMKSALAIARQSGFPRPTADALYLLGRWESDSSDKYVGNLTLAAEFFSKAANGDREVEALAREGFQQFLNYHESVEQGTFLAVRLQEYLDVLSSSSPGSDPLSVKRSRAAIGIMLGTVKERIGESHEADAVFRDMLRATLAASGGFEAASTVASWWAVRNGPAAASYGAVRKFLVDTVHIDTEEVVEDDFIGIAVQEINEGFEYLTAHENYEFSAV